MKEYKLYLFDFDGTICDTSSALEMVFYKSYQDIGVTINKEDSVTFSREPINVSYARLGCDMEKFWDFVAIINKYLNGKESVNLSYPYDDAIAVFEILKERNIDSGIVTSNNIPHCKEIFENSGIDLSFMKVFVGNQECITPKPNPDPILKALELLNYKGDLQDVVYIGDSRNDYKAAMNAHVDAYLLDRFDEYDPSEYKVIHSLLDLFEK